MRETPIKIMHQGDPVLAHDTGYGVVGNDGVVCFYIDMHTKRCDVTASSNGDCGPEIFITMTEASPDYKEDNDWTIIAFPEFKGFQLHAAMCSRYTISVALRKEDL